MQRKTTKEEDQDTSHREWLEVLEEHTTKITNILDGVTSNMAELRMAMTTANEKIPRSIEAMRKL